MLRRLAFAATLLALVLPAPSQGASTGADVAFEGGTAREHAQVRAALAASSFDWRLLGRRVTVHIGPYGTSHSSPGHVWLEGRLLRSRRLAWA